MDNKELDLEIRDDDLNAQFAATSAVSVSDKGGVPVPIKGTWYSAYKKYVKQLDILKEKEFIEGMREDILKFEMERYEYKNLPEGIDKYRIENKLLNSGSVVFVKLENSTFAVMNYTMIDYNIYNEATIIEINEPKSNMNGKRLNVANGEAVVYRNNIFLNPSFVLVKRYINAMEKILFQIEKNITAAAPKGIINLKNSEMIFDDGDNAAMKQSMEQIINSEDTFHAIRRSEDYSATGENEDPIFIPLELRDRSDELIKLYTFAKEQIKEKIGAAINIHQKKERAIVGEIDGQQGFSTSNRQHPQNLRQVDIDKINKAFNLNIEIEILEDTIEQEEGPEREGE